MSTEYKTPAQKKDEISGKNYYEILGLESSCTKDDIKKAYRELAIKWHPDKNTDPNSAEVFKIIQTAYEVLSNDEKRENYNASFSFESLVEEEKSNIDRIVARCIRDEKTADLVIQRISDHWTYTDGTKGLKPSTQLLIDQLSKRFVDVFKIVFSHHSMIKKHFNFVIKYLAHFTRNYESAFAIGSRVSDHQKKLAEFITEEHESLMVSNLIASKELMTTLISLNNHRHFWRLLLKVPKIGVEIASRTVRQLPFALTLSDCFEVLEEKESKCPELFNYIIKNHLQKYIQHINHYIPPLQRLKILFERYPEETSDFFRNPPDGQLSWRDLIHLLTYPTSERLIRDILNSPIVSIMYSFTKHRLYELAEENRDYAKSLLMNSHMEHDEKRLSRLLIKWPTLYSDALLLNKLKFASPVFVASQKFVSQWFERSTMQGKLYDQEKAQAVLIKYIPHPNNSANYRYGRDTMYISLESWCKAFSQQPPAAQENVLEHFFKNNSIRQEEKKQFLKELYTRLSEGWGKRPPVLMQICRDHPKFAASVEGILKEDAKNSILSTRHEEELSALKKYMADKKTSPGTSNHITESQIVDALSAGFNFKKTIYSSESDLPAKKAAQKWLKECKFDDMGQLTPEGEKAFIIYVLEHEYRKSETFSFVKADRRFELDKLMMKIREDRSFAKIVETLEGIKARFGELNLTNLAHPHIGDIILQRYKELKPKQPSSAPSMRNSVGTRSDTAEPPILDKKSGEPDFDQKRKQTDPDTPLDEKGASFVLKLIYGEDRDGKSVVIGAGLMNARQITEFYSIEDLYHKEKFSLLSQEEQTIINSMADPVEEPQERLNIYPLHLKMRS